MSARRHAVAPLLGLLVAAGAPRAAAPAVRVGSKQFTESVVLGELLAQLGREAGAAVEHRRELGGTRIVWAALTTGEIDAYVEYTGTLQEEILAGEGIRGEEAIRARLATMGIHMGRPLGFDNTYVLGMKAEPAAELGLRTVSDLRGHPELVLGLSHEFMDREDGWPALRAAYGLAPADVRGLQHDLAYVAMEEGAIDVTDLYSTDAEIAKYGLAALEDDRHHFPEYRAVVVSREGLPSAVREAFGRLEGRIDAPAMVRMNAAAKLDKVSESRVAAGFLARALGTDATVTEETRGERILQRTGEHLLLVLPSLLAAALLAIPLGTLAARRPRLGQLVLGAAGIVQTIPSLAILVFMIPLLGIGYAPSLAALFLYGLLPIVRNTHAGLTGIPAATLEAADAIGLAPAARLRLVELPLAAPAILAGVKTSAVITVGTATLGALIGAGGYGQPILTGIRLDDVGLILEGALPAAILALACQAAFDLVEPLVVPRGLRLARA